jgi:hypothetical protein
MIYIPNLLFIFQIFDHNYQIYLQALQDHKKVYPGHDKFILQTDGAGCYSGFGLMCRLGYLNLTVGVRLLRHYTGEQKT